MPPKGKKGGGGAKDHKFSDDQRQEPLQAVIFADSFETRFNPFALETPRCLLPLANTPLIEYTLEFLAGAGAEEVFLYSGNHTDAVEAYLHASKWTSPTSPFALEVIRSSSKSVGDCMRDLDQKGLIVGDFICVYGDVVANVPLEAALADHRARRERDKKCIMTMLLREAGAGHRVRPLRVRPTFVLDAETGRCVHYEQSRAGGSAMLDVPGEVLKEHVELEIREDLVDCGIDICTPEVLAQYNDNFDWQLPRTGFLRGVLKDFETFQLMIHTHLLTEGYAARVENLHAYDAICRDVVSRWTYPLTPDTNLVDHQSFQLYKGNVYREDGVVLARSSVVQRRVVLGKGTSVGDQSTITNSVIGRRCVIGKRVKIDGAYIWDDVRIDDDSVIETSVIADGASIGKHCKIERGALISYGVRIGDNFTVSAKHRLSTLKRKRGYENDVIEQAQTDPKAVGEGGVGHCMEFDEDDEDVSEGLVVDLQDLELAVDEISTLDSDEDSDEDELDHHFARSSSMRSDSFASIDSEESGETRRQARDFHKEAVNSLYDDLQKGADPDTMQLEFKPLILAANAQDNHIRRALAVGFNRHIASLVENGDSPKDAVAAVLPKYKQLIQSYLSEQDEQAEFLLFVQTDLLHRPQGGKVLHQLSYTLAMNDLVDAEGFEQWWNDAKSSASPEMEAVRQESKQVVDFLCASSGEESSDEEEDSDEE